jgi:hypothetical protein
MTDKLAELRAENKRLLALVNEAADLLENSMMFMRQDISDDLSLECRQCGCIGGQHDEDCEYGEWLSRLKSINKANTK